MPTWLESLTFEIQLWKCCFSWVGVPRHAVAGAGFGSQRHCNTSGRISILSHFLFMSFCPPLGLSPYAKKGNIAPTFFSQQEHDMKNSPGGIYAYQIPRIEHWIPEIMNFLKWGSKQTPETKATESNFRLLLPFFCCHYLSSFFLPFFIQEHGMENWEQCGLMVDSSEIPYLFIEMIVWVMAVSSQRRNTRKDVALALFPIFHCSSDYLPFFPFFSTRAWYGKFG